MAPTRLEAEVTARGDWTTIVLDGEVDMASAPQLEQAIAEQLAAGAARLMVDLSEVTFMDSTGLTVLFRAHEDAVKAGAEFVVVCGPGSVRRVIEVSGVGGVVPIYADPAEVGAQ